jgi:hypothetical protein
MKDILPDHLQDIENLNDEEKLDHACHDMEMLYRSRCGSVPLVTNVKVVEVETDVEGKE